MNDTRQQVKLMNMVNGEELEGIGGDVGKQYTKWRVNRDRTGADVVLSGFSCLCFIHTYCKFSGIRAGLLISLDSLYANIMLW